MTPESTCFSFVFYLLLTAIVSWLCRYLVLKQMKKIGPASANAKPLNTDLHPAELAYLFRPGDSSHCLIVLTVDALQKAVKAQGTNAPSAPALAYEREIWPSVKDYIQEWSSQKIQEVIPEFGSKNPLTIISGVLRIRIWIWNLIKGFLSELIKDPLHIRKYFSPAVFVRLFAKLAASGVKDKLADNLRSSLLAKELLVPEKRRHQFSAYLALLALAQTIALTLVLLSLPPAAVPALSFALTILVTLANGFFLRVFAFLPSLLPLYDEITQVLDSVSKKGFRINVLRAVLKLGRLLYWCITGIISALLLVLQSYLMAQFGGLNSANWAMNIPIFALLSINFFIMLGVLALAYRIRMIEQITLQGESQLKQYHLNLQKTSLTNAIARAISDRNYDAELSEIVAIYGIETLILIA